MGFAIDLQLPSVGAEDLILKLQRALGPAYAVVKEKKHIHLEFRIPDAPAAPREVPVVTQEG